MSQACAEELLSFDTSCPVRLELHVMTLPGSQLRYRSASVSGRYAEVVLVL